MNEFTDIFVFSKVNKEISGDIGLEKMDVGIAMKEKDNGVVVFFVRPWKKVVISESDFQVFDVNKTGDAYPKKICNICHKLKDTIEFDKNQNGINNRAIRRPSCGDCRKILEGMNVKPKVKREWLKTMPNKIPFECPICSKRTIPGVTSKVVLDHNHISGEPRAWICDSCNTGIGRFKDDIALLQRAIEYLG